VRRRATSAVLGGCAVQRRRWRRAVASQVSRRRLRLRYCACVQCVTSLPIPCAACRAMLALQLESDSTDHAAEELLSVVLAWRPAARVAESLRRADGSVDTLASSCLRDGVDSVVKEGCRLAERCLLRADVRAAVADGLVGRTNVCDVRAAVVPLSFDGCAGCQHDSVAETYMAAHQVVASVRPLGCCEQSETCRAVAAVG
jgi:hypothetical protein